MKQRDIMIALTARLNERDETIIRMQEELKAYDSEYRRVEDALDAKTAELIALRRAAMQHSAESPHRNPDLVNALGGWAGNNNNNGGNGGGGGNMIVHKGGSNEVGGGGGGVGGTMSVEGSPANGVHHASGGGGGGGEEEALRAELRRSEDARKDAMSEIDRLRAEALVFASRSNPNTAATSTSNPGGGGGGGSIDRSCSGCQSGCSA